MGSSIKKAVIPAAGLGTRFLPVTRTVSKVMLPVFNIPTIDFAVAFGSVFLATGIWYSLDKNNPKIDSILIPVIAVFIYRIFGRMFGNVIKTIKRRNET